MHVHLSAAIAHTSTAERETKETKETDHSKSKNDVCVKHRLRNNWSFLTHFLIIPFVVKHLAKHIVMCALEHLRSARKSFTKCRDHPAMWKSCPKKSTDFYRGFASGPSMPFIFSTYQAYHRIIYHVYDENWNCDPGCRSPKRWFTTVVCNRLCVTRSYYLIPACGQNVTSYCCDSHQFKLHFVAKEYIPSTSFDYTMLQRAWLDTSLHYTTIHHTESQTNWSTVQSLLAPCLSFTSYFNSVLWIAGVAECYVL